MEGLKACIRECEEFKYLGVKIDKEDRQENDIKNRINKALEMDYLRRSARVSSLQKNPNTAIMSKM